ncbi:hypothetical protein KIN20_033001 [Parelaphostrongylus tenuis]|uniref:ShKT domain-containing protein n=1 Tax=Parelaphostrongylus tenuis TaxID=148309 RepID=A0AAD5R7X6_PARTN|nr:hypothetical protein KIN20_033001 [Parelaphostrongylus tenuis]
MPVMVPHDPKYMRTMGSAILGFYDILMMNMHYMCTASGGPDVSETTSARTSGPTSRPTSRLTTPTTSPKSSCKDRNVCTKLVEKWNFCRDAKYDNELRKFLCPKSCGFCP